MIHEKCLKITVENIHAYNIHTAPTILPDTVNSEIFEGFLEVVKINPRKITLSFADVDKARPCREFLWWQIHLFAQKNPAKNLNLQIPYATNCEKLVFFQLKVMTIVL